MKEVIDKIFVNNGFENISITNPFSDETSFWGNYSKKATNFYLIVYVNEITEGFIVERVSEYFNAIKTIDRGYDERMDKNLSMLICLKNTHTDSSPKYKKIFEIEEEPYFFKKYLLSYNENFQKIKKEILDGENINITINNVINNVEKFHQYKSGEASDDAELYEICTKLMTKIPFISLNHKQTDLDNLSKSIRIRLEKDNLKESRDKILQFFELEEDDFIDKIIENIKLGNVEDEQTKN